MDPLKYKNNSETDGRCGQNHIAWRKTSKKSDVSTSDVRLKTNLNIGVTSKLCLSTSLA